MLRVLSEARSVFDTMTCEAAKKQVGVFGSSAGFQGVVLCRESLPLEDLTTEAICVLCSLRHVVRHLAEPCLVYMRRMA